MMAPALFSVVAVAVGTAGGVVCAWLVDKRPLCRHRFRMGDMELTGIPEPEKPGENADYREWDEYFRGLEKSDWHCKRVRWACCRCGRVFYAHCGLDVLSRHGEAVR